jgi:hypothetical protein
MIELKGNVFILNEVKELNLSFNHLLYDNVIGFCRNLPALSKMEILEENKIYLNNFGGPAQGNEGNSRTTGGGGALNRVNNDILKLVDGLKMYCGKLEIFNDNGLETFSGTPAGSQQNRALVKNSFFKELETKLCIKKSLDLKFFVRWLDRVERLNSGNLVKKSPEYCLRFLETQQPILSRKLLVYQNYFYEFLSKSPNTTLAKPSNSGVCLPLKIFAEKFYRESLTIQRHSMLKYWVRRYIRRFLKKRRWYLANLSKIVKLQSWYRGRLTRRIYNFYGNPLLRFKRHLDKIILIQKRVRGYRYRKRYLEFTKGLKLEKDTSFDSDEENFDLDCFGSDKFDEFKQKLQIPENIMDFLSNGLNGGLQAQAQAQPGKAKSKPSSEKNLVGKKNFKIRKPSLQGDQISTIRETKDSFYEGTTNISAIKKHQRSESEERDLDGISIASNSQFGKLNYSRQISQSDANNRSVISRNDSAISTISLGVPIPGRANDSEIIINNSQLDNDSNMYSRSGNGSRNYRANNCSSRVILKANPKPKIETQD